jgi:hypothetical protein
VQRQRWGIKVVLPLAGLLIGAGCEPLPEMLKLPIQVEVENPGHLRVVVVPMSKQPLAGGELPPSTQAGVRWEHEVLFTETAGIGVQFREVEATVRSLTGFVATRTIPLSSRVEPQGTTPISIAASLVTSNPSEPGNLSGVQELVFLGRNDRGGLIRVIVRVPLE